jgi:hypothetical protein
LKPAIVALLGLLAVFAVGYAVVSPANFSGWDEWLVIDLTSRGEVALPFENRPFSLLFNLPGSVLTPTGLRGFWLVHGLYLWIAASSVFFLARRLAPGEERLAFLSAAIAATWAPRDDMRLDAVLLANYSGAAAATLVAAVALVESVRARRPLLLGAGALLGFIAVRALESTAALVVTAPALLWLVPGSVDRGERARRLRYTLGWTAIVLPALALAVWPLLPGAPPSYQSAGLGLDPHPGHVAVRLARQIAFQLLPLVSTDPRELLAASAGLAALSFLVAWAGLGRLRTGLEDARGGGSRLVAAGLGATVLGHAVLVLSPAMTTPSRMQILSAPGIGLLLAGGFAAATLPLGPRARGASLALLGCAVVALGTARTATWQRAWDERSLWPAQKASLSGIVREAPGLADGTLLLLLDEGGAWPASFTFRHAVRYLYGSTVIGTVWGAEPFLYPVHLVPEGAVSAPYESIRVPWQVPVTFHPYGAVVVMRAHADGRAEILDRWPGDLPKLPAGAVYEPRRRVVGAPFRAERAILAGAGGPSGH